jgi:hypothetical protein
MKRSGMKGLIMALALPAMLLASCEKDTYCRDVSDPVQEIPWMRQLVEARKNSSSNLEIHAYAYKGQEVFVVNDCNSCADAMTVAYTCDGDTICEWGGLTGANTCPDFTEVATNKRLVYKNY